MRTSLHYIAALILLTIYGGQVCPLIDTLTLVHWGSIVAITFIPLTLLRFLLLPKVVEEAPFHDQPLRQFHLEFGLFITFGIALSIYDTLELGFPALESGLKVVLGFATFGFFIGADLALSRQRHNSKTIIEQDIITAKLERYTSLPRRFSTFALTTVTLAGTILILTVAKDVYWMRHNTDLIKESFVHVTIMAEVGFILFLLCAYSLLIIHSYTQNMQLFFANENNVLRKVRDGDLNSRVPTLTKDEFGEIADHTNAMINGLRERDRIKIVFGKTVSPTIASRLMRQAEEGFSMGGSMQPLVILLSDIRGFTARTESSNPKTVLKDLNAWFAEAVESICNHDGVVDKFIGDGILAVFGLDGDMAACEKAVACARDMLIRLERLNPELSEPFSIGIGIHKGEVLAGIVGSPERLEFTVVGDVVNTASRIEAMTRELGASVLISEAVKNDLETTMPMTDWINFGEWSLKGKAQPVGLFGLPLNGNGKK